MTGPSHFTWPGTSGHPEACTCRADTQWAHCSSDLQRLRLTSTEGAQQHEIFCSLQDGLLVSSAGLRDQDVCVPVQQPSQQSLTAQVACPASEGLQFA